MNKQESINKQEMKKLIALLEEKLLVDDIDENIEWTIQQNFSLPGYSETKVLIDSYIDLYESDETFSLTFSLQEFVKQKDQNCLKILSPKGSLPCQLESFTRTLYGENMISNFLQKLYKEIDKYEGIPFSFFTKILLSCLMEMETKKRYEEFCEKCGIGDDDMSPQKKWFMLFWFYKKNVKESKYLDCRYSFLQETLQSKVLAEILSNWNDKNNTSIIDGWLITFPNKDTCIITDECETTETFHLNDFFYKKEDILDFLVEKIYK